MKDFHDLKVWEKAHLFTLSVYEASAKFPRQELFGLTSQIRRAAYSIPCNIAEGCGRGTDADFARFLQMAMGSASETEYQLLLAHDLGFIEAKEHRGLTLRVTEIKRMLYALIRATRAANKSTGPAETRPADSRKADS